MGSSSRVSAVRPDRESGRTPLRVFALPRRSLILLGLALLTLLAATSTAVAAETHVFSAEKSFLAEGECKLTEPGGIAVNDTTGDIFVFDRGANAIDRFDRAGKCLKKKRFGLNGSVGEETNEGIAINNDPTSNAFGDVYVVNAEKKEVLKFQPEAGGENKLNLVGTIKKFRRKENGEVVEEFEEFEEIHGLSVDGQGNLWVAEAEALDEFAPVETEPPKRELAARIEVPSTSCSERPGFALTADAKTFYLGRERENRKGECEEPTVVMKLNELAEPVSELAFNAQLDLEPTSGVAVDHSNGVVYFDNKTSLSAFAASEDFIERFGHGASEGELQESTGVAVNSATHEVLAVDAHGSRIVVYVPGAPREGPGGEPGSGLPDHRAYEQVTPQNKFGASLYPISVPFGMVQAAEDGSAITFTSQGPVVADPPNVRSIEPSQSLARRGAGSWSTEGIGTPRNSTQPGGYGAGNGTEYEYFTSDLKAGFVAPSHHEDNFPAGFPLSPEASEATIYARDLSGTSTSCEPVPSTCYHALVSPADVTAPGAHFGNQVTLADATPDGQHAIVSSSVALTGEPIGKEAIYEWHSGSALQLVSVLPSGEVGPPEKAKLGGAGEGAGGILPRALSNDGSRVVWSTSENQSPGALYIRDTTKGETLRLDKAQEGTAEPENAQAQFWSASTDGSRVFFTDTAPLLPGAHVPGEEEEELNPVTGFGDLYACEIAEVAGKLTCKLTDLTRQAEGSTEAPGVQGVMGTSEDGSYVYFAADGAFGNTAGPGKCTPRERGQVEEELAGLLPVRHCNIYVAHRGPGGWETPKLVAAVTSEDQPDWRPDPSIGALAQVTSRVSPSGGFLAFMSDSSLTGYDNRATNPEAHNKAAEEVFLYSAASGDLTCASCNPSKQRPNAVFDPRPVEGGSLLVEKAETWGGRWLAANVPGWTARSPETAIYQSRYLSDTGHVFFNSADKLVEADTNGKMDVYQFEPNGEGTCASVTGCVGLLSGGTSSQESAFLDASANGGSVFFLTSQQLVKQDIDSGYDIYDARVCSSESPCLGSPPESAAPCPDESGCKAAATEAPAAPAVPPSQSVVGPGNKGTIQVLGETETAKPTPKPLTKAQKLKLALKKCKKIKKHKKRLTCEKQARKKYGAKKTKKASGKKAHR